CDAGIEAVSGQRILAAQELECVGRHDEMQKTLFAANRAIALGDARQIRRYAKAHPPAMAAAFIATLHSTTPPPRRTNRTAPGRAPARACRGGGTHAR